MNAHARWLLTLITLLLAGLALAQDPAPRTTADTNVPVDQLEVMLVPLTADELRIEAEGWRSELQKSAESFSELELRILKRELTPKSEEREAAHKADMERLLDLAGVRDNHIDRLNMVLDLITQKVGLNADNEEPEDVLMMRRYISSVDGVRSDVVDASTVMTALIDWLKDKDGGVRVAKHLGILLGFLVGFWFLGFAMAKATNKALAMSGKATVMLSTFIRRNFPKIMLAIGALTGLAFLDVNITPLVAMIGGASFVIAFALQNTLSNFASGVMIMLYKPFDVDDYVNVAGIEGSVKSMTLVSTTVSTIDNKVIMVPNNSIWGNVITNFTGVRERRVDLVFGIGYADDIDKAEAILLDVARSHPKTLDEPAPIVKLHELADSSVNFVCRPWVKTDDYWDVYWDLMRTVKERFDAEGVSIPFPQRDVHLYTEKAPD